MTQITFQLSDLYQDQAGFRALRVGGPLLVTLDAGILSVDNTGAAGFVQQVSPSSPRLVPIALSYHAFTGPIRELELNREGEDVVAQLVVACGVSLRLSIFDPDYEPHWYERGITPYNLVEGDWLAGLVNLTGVVDEDMFLVGEPLSGGVVDIQRLCLRGGDPEFGAMRSVDEVPATRLGPDVVYVTMRLDSLLREV